MRAQRRRETCFAGQGFAEEGNFRLRFSVRVHQTDSPEVGMAFQAEGTVNPELWRCNPECTFGQQINSRWPNRVDGSEEGECEGR